MSRPDAPHRSAETWADAAQVPATRWSPGGVRSAPDSTAQIVNSSDRWKQVTAAIYASIFVLIYNPFVSLHANFKFPAMAVIPSIAILYTLVRRKGPAGLGWLPLRFALFCGFLIVVSFRPNEVFNGTGQRVVVDNMIQTWLTTFVVLSSLYIFSVVGLERYLRWIRFYATSVALYLVVVTRLNVDWFETSTAGDFTSASYQQIGEVFAVAALLQIQHLRKMKNATELGLLVFLPRVLVVMSFLFMIMQNKARGETIALVAALAVLLAPRLALILGIAVFFFPLKVISLFATLGFAGAIRLSNTVAVDDLGQRDVAIGQAWALLDDTTTLLVGRGANYFQFHYGYPFGFHPHNIFMEAAVTGGVIGFLIVTATYGVPVVKGYLAQIAGRRVDLNALSLATYYLLIASKSGTLSIGWTIGLFAPLFAILSQPDLESEAGSARARTPLDRAARPFARP